MEGKEELTMNNPDTLYITILTVWSIVTVALWIVAGCVGYNNTKYVTNRSLHMRKLGALIAIIAPLWPLASTLACIWTFTTLMRKGTLPIKHAY